MDDKKLIEKNTPEELIRAGKLIDDAKLDEALTLLNNYEQKEGLSHYEINSCRLLRCQMLFIQGKLKELTKHAKQLYKESEGLVKILHSTILNGPAWRIITSPTPLTP